MSNIFFDGIEMTGCKA